MYLRVNKYLSSKDERSVSKLTMSLLNYSKDRSGLHASLSPLSHYLVKDTMHLIWRILGHRAEEDSRLWAETRLSCERFFKDVPL